MAAARNRGVALFQWKSAAHQEDCMKVYLLKGNFTNQWFDQFVHLETSIIHAPEIEVEPTEMPEMCHIWGTCTTNVDLQLHYKSFLPADAQHM
eukprot:10596074-Karenia_brevis.AAC.1